MSIEIQLNRVDRVYRPGEKVTGAVIVKNKGGMSHNGIKITVDGSVALQLSARSVGLFEAFYSSLKPVPILNYTIEVVPSGKITTDVAEFPFEFQLKPLPNRALYDTYHGVYVNIQYMIHCDLERPLLAKNIKKQVEFIVENIDESKRAENNKKPFTFSISPNTLQNVRKNSKHKIPDFLFEGRLESTVCDLNELFSGEIVIRKCAVDIKSIELQLVRVETCAYLEGEAREATEIQNIQIAEGNVVRDLLIPIQMIFPRLFTCSTTAAKEFKVQFEVNLIILFTDNHMVTENFPIVLYR